MTNAQIFSNLADTIRSNDIDTFNEQLERLNDQELQEILDMSQDGDNLLYIAIKQDRIDMVNALLQKGIDIEARNYEDFTALQLASQKGLTSIVELIIPHDDIKNYKIYEEKDCNSNNVRLNPLILATQEKHYQTIELLINNNFYTNELHYFASEIICNENFDKYKELLEFLKDKGYNFKAKDSRGWNALICFTDIQKWNEELFNFLVQDKALNLINEPNNKGDTFLYEAFSYRLFEDDVTNYKKLIDAGADYRITNNYGWTVLHYVICISSSNEEMDFLLPYFFEDTDDFNFVSYFAQALEDGADPSYLSDFYYTAAKLLDVNLMKLFINYGKPPYYWDSQESDEIIECLLDEDDDPGLQMMAFLNNKGFLFPSKVILEHLDDVLTILEENKQREFEDNEDELENQEFKTLNTPEEQILGIMNLLIALGNGLNDAGEDQELINDYSVALEKLKAHIDNLELEELGNALKQKIVQAHKETDPKNAHSNVLFFKTLCNSYYELADMMLNDEAADLPINLSNDAQEILERITNYIDADAVYQIAECASFAYLMRNARKHDLQQNSQDITVTRSKILPWIDKATQGILGQICKAPVLELINGLINLSIKKHETDEPANKRLMLDLEESRGAVSMHHSQISDVMEFVMPPILGEGSDVGEQVKTL
ncbi:hypothetical protein phytr_1650 [Candidatus Phycorickettsia trachydisci]|uniref:Uncharacterized protein n=1 Tax=Candidatus Phycorickettsia trachydisci TaxID=2115978 RepID=A0A2P1P776_9RICK|nr:ankyrin repeat domain-containing protein [Candidatus Phycorickettsia trachydisci]AVP87124.1 hypothetical protein phytr_1650 [Candidatus Phycorickettsia trachydisci]